MRLQVYIAFIAGIFILVSGIWVGWNMGKPGDDTDFEGKYREAEARIESLERELEKFGNIIGDLREEIERTEKLIERQREVERILEERIREHEEHNGRLREIVGILERENHDLRDRIRADIVRAEAIETGLGELEALLQIIEESGVFAND